MAPQRKSDVVLDSVKRLLRLGVIVRPLAGYEMPDHLRVTIGTPAENEAFLKALAAALKG